MSVAALRQLLAGWPSLVELAGTAAASSSSSASSSGPSPAQLAADFPGLAPYHGQEGGKEGEDEGDGGSGSGSRTHSMAGSGLLLEPPRNRAGGQEV